MKKLMILLLLALSVALFGCGGEQDTAEVKTPAEESAEVAQASRTLTLEWQRMIDEEGNVCCGSEDTRIAVEAAREKLAQELKDHGIKVVLTKSDFSPDECRDCPERANRIMVAGYGVDYWLGAEVGKSPCEGFCKQALGDKGSCQNLIYEGKTYEVVPAELIVKAGLAAAAHPSTFKAAGKCAGCPSKGRCPSSMKTAASCKGNCDCACCEAGKCACKGNCACTCCKAGKCRCDEIACTCEGECDGSCQKICPCGCKGACDGTCKAKELTTKAEDVTTKAAGCPNAKTCSRKGCPSGS
jgi:hypothetical protein